MVPISVTVPKANRNAEKEMDKVNHDDNHNYWGWTDKIKGTLSSISLTTLAKAKDTAQQQPHPQQQQVSMEATASCNSITTKSEQEGGYWAWQETIKKTLSSVSLGGSTMEKNKEMKNCHQNDRTKVDTNNAPTNWTNYWHWRNSFKSASDLARNDKTTVTCATSQRNITSSGSDNTTTSGGSYWFWRSPSRTNVHDNNNNNSKEGSNENHTLGGNTTYPSTCHSPGPMTHLEHKVRNSWRKSFQQLSNQSLVKLEEDREETRGFFPSLWKQSFRSFQTSLPHLDPVIVAPSVPMEEDVDVVVVVAAIPSVESANISSHDVAILSNPCSVKDVEDDDDDDDDDEQSQSSIGGIHF